MAMPRKPRLAPRADGSIDELPLPSPLLDARGSRTITSLIGEPTSPSPELFPFHKHANEHQQKLKNATPEQRNRSLLDRLTSLGVSSERLSQYTPLEIEAAEALAALRQVGRPQSTSTTKDTLPPNGMQIFAGESTTMIPSSSFQTEQKKPREPAPPLFSDQQQQASLRRSQLSPPPPAPTSPTQTANPNQLSHLRTSLPTLASAPPPLMSSPTRTAHTNHPSHLMEPPKKVAPEPSTGLSSQPSTAPSSRASKPNRYGDRKIEYKPIITATQLLERITTKEPSTSNQKSLNEFKLAREIIIHGAEVDDRCMGCRLDGLPCFFRDSGLANEGQTDGNQGMSAKDSRGQKQRCAGCIFRHLGGCERIAGTELQAAERALLLKRGEKRERANVMKRARRANGDEGRGGEDAKRPKLSAP